MPEGDTIFRTAARLRPVLKGQRVERARGWARLGDAGALVGGVVRAVEARGKHLLIHLDDGRVVHSHLGMTGSWHLYAPGEPWQKPERRAALVIETGQAVCVCFSPKTLELLTADGLRRHEHLRRLGPDLLGPPPDEAEVLRRFRARDAVPIGEALLDQTIVCGIGNVYKSEVLFVERVDPFTAVGALGDADLLRLVARGRELLLKNVGGYPRKTRFRPGGSRHWVYGRNGRPCYACGGPIRVRRQGEQGRTTYWCPACQE
jgi:endonuclease-8